VPIRWILLLALLAAPLTAENAARIAAELRATVLDEAECYRVREMTFLRGDARFYLTDGYLIFGQPVEGVRIVAAFYAPDAINDAEILLRPPDRGERASLAAHTGTPNLNEHFRQALFVATDGSLDQWRAELLDRPLTRRDP
jgi:hypothetical protein